MSEARVARDTAQFALPPSEMAVGAGDVVVVDDGGVASSFRIDRIESAGLQNVEAVRVEAGVYQASDAVETVVRPKPFVAPVPVESLFLDLPLLTGDEVEHAPHVAATGRPWPGSVAVFSSSSDDGYELNALLTAASVVGVTETALPVAAAGLLDRGEALRVRLVHGAIASVENADLLNGANVAAIGDGSSDNWEVLQFQSAELVAPQTYDISARLRGQAGTDAVIPQVWPVGSFFVLLNGAAKQIALAASARGLARHYRVGPALRAFDDPSYHHKVEAFDGIGLRPYAPVHVRASLASNGDYTLTWVRRTRIDGDSWQSFEVPLGEQSEIYVVRIAQSGTIMREISVTEPSFIYTAAAKAVDGLSGTFEFAVAQNSERFGPGPFRRITIDG